MICFWKDLWFYYLLQLQASAINLVRQVRFRMLSCWFSATKSRFTKTWNMRRFGKYVFLKKKIKTAPYLFSFRESSLTYSLFNQVYLSTISNTIPYYFQIFKLTIFYYILIFDSRWISPRSWGKSWLLQIFKLLNCPKIHF